MRELSRNANVLRFLVEADSGVGRIKLAKYAYLADLESLRLGGRPISQFRYFFDNHGPFDNTQFFSALDELKSLGILVEETARFWKAWSGYRYSTTSPALHYQFSEAEDEILRFVVAKYRPFSAQRLCDEIVYKTAPMLVARKGKEIQMNLVQAEGSDPLGFNLERMLAGEKSARAGKHRPIAEAMRELRARYNG